MLLHLLTLFFFNAPATPEIYTLSLHDALPIYRHCRSSGSGVRAQAPDRSAISAHHDYRESAAGVRFSVIVVRDRKSTRLNSSHVEISYAVFCLKKKKKT